MRLDRLLVGVDVLQSRGDPTGTEISGVAHDARLVRAGSLFCCLPGSRSDGHDHAAEAVRAGASALLCERLLPLDVVQVTVPNARAAMAQTAASFHGHPSRDLPVIGVTGTNGKTTTTHLLHAIFEAHGWEAGLIGTLGGLLTTPESPEVQARLRADATAGRKAVVMEVSSHALVQHRVDAVCFAVVAFTNLSRDHLDFHGTMDSYFAAKTLLFDPSRAIRGVVNADDPYGQRLLASAPIPLRPYSLGDAVELRPQQRGSTFIWEGHPVSLQLGGAHNVANGVCAAAIARELDVPPKVIAAGLSSVDSVPGRYERVDVGQAFKVVVDYAHTPDALEQVLRAARQEASAGRVLVVFGCGGQRDPSKRPLMGDVAGAAADVAVLTSDNPRGEDPLVIIEEVRAGVRLPERLIVEPDREAAIRLAVGHAAPGDVVVIAGKGHETGQAFADRVVPFDDREAARRALEDLS